jgi:hypothetical protein
MYNYEIIQACALKLYSHKCFSDRDGFICLICQVSNVDLGRLSSGVYRKHFLESKFQVPRALNPLCPEEGTVLPKSSKFYQGRVLTTHTRKIPAVEL